MCSLWQIIRVYCIAKSQFPNIHKWSHMEFIIISFNSCIQNMPFRYINHILKYSTVQQFCKKATNKTQTCFTCMAPLMFQHREMQNLPLNFPTLPCSKFWHLSKQCHMGLFGNNWLLANISKEASKPNSFETWIRCYYLITEQRCHTDSNANKWKQSCIEYSKPNFGLMYCRINRLTIHKNERGGSKIVTCYNRQSTMQSWLRPF